MRTQQTKQYQLTAIDYEYIKLVKTFHFLNCNLLLQLRGLSVHSKPKVQTKLLQLYSAGYLERRSLPSSDVGAKEYIYALSTKSIRILEEMGYTGFSRFRPDEFQQYAFPFLNHCIELNKLLVAAHTLERFVASISCVQMYHDYDIKKLMPVTVTIERTHERYTIIPDAFIDMRMKVEGQEKRRRRCICIELDRGTESAVVWKKKIAAYFSFAISEQYKGLYNTNLCMVAYATTAGKQRLQQMIEWCEQTLKQEGLEHEANLFRFTALPDGEYNPKALFCSAIWYKPFEAEPVPLLWQV